MEGGILTGILDLELQEGQIFTMNNLCEMITALGSKAIPLSSISGHGSPIQSRHEAFGKTQLAARILFAIKNLPKHDTTLYVRLCTARAVNILLETKVIQNNGRDTGFKISESANTPNGQWVVLKTALKNSIHNQTVMQISAWEDYSDALESQEHPSPLTKLEISWISSHNTLGRINLLERWILVNAVPA